MKKVKSVKPGYSKFNKEYQLQVGNFVIAKGDIIKIEGEHGIKFKFESLTTNTENGKVWVDCFEMQKKVVGGFRSFSPDRVKRIPAKRGKKNDN